MAVRHSFPVTLVGDVGGTNCRLALVGGAGGFDFAARFACRTDDYADPAEAIAAFLATWSGDRPRYAALALAAPAEAEPVQLTNTSWRFSRQALREELGFEEVVFVNDLAAQARAVLDAPEGDIVSIGPSARDWRRAAVSVVGPGTGLGVARLDPSAPIPVTPTEGGHVGFAPNDDVELEMLRYWSGHLGRVTNEHVISGPGLVRVYRALAAITGAAVEPIQGPEIMRRALAHEDPACVDAVERFAKIFGAVCADIVLAQGAHALALVGGIATSMQPVLQQGGFRARFEQRGPGSNFLCDAPSLLITTPDIGLRGAAAAMWDALAANRAHP